MNGYFKKISLTLIFGAWAFSLHAEEIPEHFKPVRPIGMGDAFTAVANDQDAIWTNPAGIARVRKARSRSTFNLTKVPNIIVGINGEGRNFYDGFKSAQEKSVEAIIEATESLGSKPFWVRAGLFPVTLFDVAPGAPMAFGVYSNTTVKALIEKESPEVARIETISDVGEVLSFAFTDQSNRFNAGLQVRPIYRYAYEDKIPSDDLINKAALRNRMKEDANKSQGLGVDFGMMYTIADFWFPTIGIAVLNLPTGCRDGYLNPFTEKPETVCGNVYRGEFGNKDALSTVDPTDVRLGVAITPRLSHTLAMRFALDAHHLPIGSSKQSYGLQGIEASKLVHAGVELFFGNPLTPAPFSVRAGYSQGFATVGVSLNMPYVSLEFASYGVDVSSTKKPIEDRRVLGSLSFDF